MEWQHRTGKNDGRCNAASQESKSCRRADSAGWNRAWPTGEELARYLHRNGVLCEPITVQPEGRSTGEAILAYAASLQCDLLIKGAYTQSRLRQMIFGGATRHILANASLPVLMAH